MSEDVGSFIDEEFLHKLSALKILSQRGVRGSDRGENISWRGGGSLEFLDYRKYQAGDDFRYVDWNVYGRQDKLFIKLFRAEENQTIHILLDISKSMGFGHPNKAIYAKKIAAAISYLALSNLDRVKITSFDHSLRDMMPPARSRLSYAKVIKYLLALKPDNDTNFNQSLKEYASMATQPGIVLILSDIMDPKGYTEGLEAMQNGKFDVALVHILDERELRPSSQGHLLLREMETRKKQKIIVDDTILDTYKKRLNLFRKSIEDYCYSHHIDYYLCDTSVTFEEFLIEYVTKCSFFH